MAGDCYGNRDQGCGCGAAPPSGCVRSIRAKKKHIITCLLSSRRFSRELTTTLRGNFQDNRCGSNKQRDVCGVCGGGGIPGGYCDCHGNRDQGCGCGAAPPSGCVRSRHAPVCCRRFFLEAHVPFVWRFLSQIAGQSLREQQKDRCLWRVRGWRHSRRLL